MGYRTEELQMIDELSETQALCLGDVASLGHPMVYAMHEMLDLDEFPVGADGMIALLPAREPVLH